MLSRRPMDRQAFRVSPAQRPRGRCHHSPPPPVQALEYPTRPQEPVLVLPAPRGSPPEDRMVLTWPTQDTQSQEYTESGSMATPDGRNTATYHARAIVTVSPSGETTMHIQSSYYSVRSPAGGSGGTRLHHSPSSGGPRGYTTPGRSAKQLTFPGTPGSRFRGSPQSSSFMTPRTGLGASPLADSTNAPKPGRSLLFDDSSLTDPTVRRRKLPAHPSSGRGDARTSRDMGLSSDRQGGDSNDRFHGQKKRCSDKGYKGILEQDHPEEPTRGRGTICSLICTVFSLILLILLIVLLLWLFVPFGDPVLKIGMAPPDPISTLTSELQSNVYGQHIAKKLVVSALYNSLIGQGAYQNPVIMSFHGSTGVGKTHMADILSRHFKETGSKTTCANTFLTDFHVSTMDLLSAPAYEDVIQNWVKEQLKQRSCIQIFLIFDELRADAPPELAIALSHVISEIKMKNLGDNHDIVVIIMSDIGMHDINAHMTGLWDKGSPRENTTVEEVKLLIKNAALYLDKNPQQSDTPSGGDTWQDHSDRGPFSALLSLVDSVIPFLPLEQDHVKLCVIRDVISKGGRLVEEDITWVADQLTYFPASTQIFSMSGCKKVPEKVDLLRTQYGYHN